ncbi:MAG: hypothetical protein Q8P67_24205 [archaeon]|nr:hypothetical protein [archaeon]
MAATIDEETIEEEMNANRKPRLYSGVMVRGGAELYPLLEEHCSSDTACFDFLVAPLYWAPTDHFLATSEKSGAFSSSGASHECEEDPLLSSSSWCHMVLGYVCGEFDLDSPSAEARSKASRALAAQIDWGAHLSLATIMLPPPLQGTNCANYAQTISLFLPQLFFIMCFFHSFTFCWLVGWLV